MQRQLKAAKTRIRNLPVEKNEAWWARGEAREAKAQRTKLLKVFHPDVSQERKAGLTAAFQIFNRLKFKVDDRDLK